MSKKSLYIIIGILLLVIVGAGGYFLGEHNSSSSNNSVQSEVSSDSSNYKAKEISNDKLTQSASDKSLSIKLKDLKIEEITQDKEDYDDKMATSSKLPKHYFRATLTLDIKNLTNQDIDWSYGNVSVTDGNGRTFTSNSSSLNSVMSGDLQPGTQKAGSNRNVTLYFAGDSKDFFKATNLNITYKDLTANDDNHSSIASTSTLDFK